MRVGSGAYVVFDGEIEGPRDPSYVERIVFTDGTSTEREDRDPSEVKEITLRQGSGEETFRATWRPVGQSVGYYQCVESGDLATIVLCDLRSRDVRSLLHRKVRPLEISHVMLTCEPDGCAITWEGRFERMDGTRGMFSIPDHWPDGIEIFEQD